MFNFDKIVAKTVESSVRGYNAAKAATPAAKAKALSFKERVAKAAQAGIEAANGQVSKKVTKKGGKK